jgi:hypothetical protein
MLLSALARADQRGWRRADLTGAPRAAQAEAAARGGQGRIAAEMLFRRFMKGAIAGAISKLIVQRIR